MVAIIGTGFPIIACVLIAKKKVRCQKILVKDFPVQAFVKMSESVNYRNWNRIIATSDDRIIVVQYKA